MQNNKSDILKNNAELELTEFGDFKVKDEYLKDYEMIDAHCHLFEGLDMMFPPVLRKSTCNMERSLFDNSCYLFFN